MDELTAVARLREDIPAGAGLDGPQRQLTAEITATTTARATRAAATAGHRTSRGYRGRLVIAGTAAVALAATVAVVQGQPSHPMPTAPMPTAVGHPGQSAPRAHGRPASATELAAYATSSAAAGPAFNPRPHQWIYIETLDAASSAGQAGQLLGPPNERAVDRSWTRVDGHQQASLQHDGKLYVSQFMPAIPTPGGWPDVRYRYLGSLPSNRAALTAIIAANVKAQNFITGTGDIGIFNAIEALMENELLPPRLLANLYGVLAALRGVHFDPSVTDIDGRLGVGLYTIQEGYLKDEIVINPVTYAYLGEQFVAIKAHTEVAQDGTVHDRKGQILGWSALLRSGIVDRPGQLP